MCLSPVYLRKDLVVDCGKCYECRFKTSRFWTFRLLCELSTSPLSLFVTLTFDDAYNVSNNLDKRDVQLFIKRLRKRLKGRSIKYFAVGEYGEESFRRHYHLILFNVYFGDDDIIRDCWYYGNVDIAPVEQGSLNYVTGYVNKKIGDADIDYEELGYTPPFRLSSKNLGIDYLRSNYEFYLKHGCFYFNGKPFPLPRIYREKLGLIVDNPDYQELVDDKVFEFKDKLIRKYNFDISVDDDVKFYDELFKTNYYENKRVKFDVMLSRKKRSL